MGDVKSETSINEGIFETNHQIELCFQALNMSLTKNAMSIFCILFVLLHTFSSGKRRDSGWGKLKATLTKKRDVDADAKKPADHFLDDGEVFLTRLYNKYFYEDGRMKTRSATISEIIHSVQGNVDGKTKNVIRFNMKGINPKEYIQKAEIRVKVVLSAGQDQSARHRVRLGLYDNMTGELISKATLLGTEPTWAVFMVRSAVVGWLRSPQTNHEVQFEVLVDTEESKTVPKVFMYGGRSPFMLVYADGRRLQGVQDGAFFRDRIRRASKTNSNKTVIAASPDPAAMCSRRDLHINSKHVFGDLIVAPLSFNIYNCAGKCDLTFAPGSFSNHAIVRLKAAEHWDRGENVTAPCCVPTKFSSLLGVLYTTTNGHVVLRQYKDMVAAECGCR